MVSALDLNGSKVGFLIGDRRTHFLNEVKSGEVITVSFGCLWNWPVELEVLGDLSIRKHY